MSTHETLKDPSATSEFLGGIPESTLAQWRYRGIGPKYLKVGRHVRYRTSDLEQWLQAHEHGGDAA